MQKYEDSVKLSFEVLQITGLPDHRDKYKQCGGGKDVHGEVHGASVHQDPDPAGGEIKTVDGRDSLLLGQVSVLQLILKNILLACVKGGVRYLLHLMKIILGIHMYRGESFLPSR